MTLCQLAEKLGTTTHILREFAPDYFPSTVGDDSDIPFLSAEFVTHAWHLSPDPQAGD